MPAKRKGTNKTTELRRLRQYYLDKHINNETYIRARRIIETEFIKSKKVLDMLTAIRRTAK